MVGDDFVAVGRDKRLPACIWRWGEPGDGVVEIANEAGCAAELAVAVQEMELAGPGGLARDEGQDFAPALVDAQWPGRTVEPGGVEIKS